MTVPPHRHSGARSLVLLHEKHLKEFADIWKRARSASLELPETSDPNYASLEALLHHVLRAARGYMVWICDKLQLPDPKIDPTPGPGDVEASLDAYVDHLSDRWATPLVDVPGGKFEKPEFESRWGTLYSIDAMLEHAVMHPIRHGFQLQNLLESR